MKTEKEMFELSFLRPKNFFKLPMQQQWDIDKMLGILDWEGNDVSDEDNKRFKAHYETEDKTNMKIIFEEGTEVKAINIAPLAGNYKAPALELDKIYTIKQIILDSQGNQHLDVGLVSELNYVRSWETKEQLPNGETIHWCHPSRFEMVNK